MTRRLMALVAALGLVAAVLGLATPAQATTTSSTSTTSTTKQQLKVATYNIYQGADLTPLVTAPTQEEFVRRAGIAYDQVVATDFPARARAISRLLKQDRPHVVGLQEVARWQKGPLDGPLEVTYDFLDILLRELRTAGLHYRAAAIDTTFSGVVPISATQQAGFTNRDAILVQEGLRVTNPQSHIYAAKLVITAPFGASFTIPRGWSAVDVELAHKRGHIRVATTHLEPQAPAIRNAQGQELHQALAWSPYPVVAVGDFNSPPTDLTGPYGIFTTGRYADAWRTIHGPEAGFTATQHPDLRNLPSVLDQRIDYAFYRPAHLSAVAVRLIGNQVNDRTPSGLWPSDHAGLVVSLRVAPRVPTRIQAGHQDASPPVSVAGDSANSSAGTGSTGQSAALAASAILLSALLLFGWRHSGSTRRRPSATR